MRAVRVEFSAAPLSPMNMGAESIDPLGSFVHVGYACIFDLAKWMRILSNQQRRLLFARVGDELPFRTLHKLFQGHFAHIRLQASEIVPVSPEAAQAYQRFISGSGHSSYKILTSIRTRSHTCYIPGARIRGSIATSIPRHLRSGFNLSCQDALPCLGTMENSRVLIGALFERAPSARRIRLFDKDWLECILPAFGLDGVPMYRFSGAFTVHSRVEVSANKTLEYICDNSNNYHLNLLQAEMRTLRLTRPADSSPLRAHLDRMEVLLAKSSSLPEEIRRHQALLLRVGSHLGADSLMSRRSDRGHHPHTQYRVAPGENDLLPSDFAHDGCLPLGWLLIRFDRYLQL